MLMAQAESGETGSGDEARMAGLERIDEVQVEVNALVRDILLDQVWFSSLASPCFPRVCLPDCLPA